MHIALVKEREREQRQTPIVLDRRNKILSQPWRMDKESSHRNNRNETAAKSTETVERAKWS